MTFEKFFSLLRAMPICVNNGFISYTYFSIFSHNQPFAQGKIIIQWLPGQSKKNKGSSGEVLKGDGPFLQQTNFWIKYSSIFDKPYPFATSPHPTYQSSWYAPAHSNSAHLYPPDLIAFFQIYRNGCITERPQPQRVYIRIIVLIYVRWPIRSPLCFAPLGSVWLGKYCCILLYARYSLVLEMIENSMKCHFHSSFVILNELSNYVHLKWICFTWCI